MMKSNHICMGVAWCVILVAACSPTIVEPIGGGPGSGCASSTDSCGGSAGDLVRGGGPGSAGVSTGGQNAGVSTGGQNAGAPSNGGSGGTGASSGTGGSAEGGAPDEVTCWGTMDEVRAIWGDCPPMLCAGVAWAQSCAGSSLGALAEVGTCDGLGLITLDFGTHGKACYYQVPLFQGGEPKLVGVAAWDDTPHYCDGTSYRIQAGTAPAVCAQQSAPKVVCGGSSGPPDASAGAGGEAGGGDTPPKAGPSACYDALSNSCQPCCPTPAPDCASKPDGYPGYRCTVAPNSFCSCQCASGNWECGC